MDPADLERDVHARLMRGAPPQAPATLRPRVMAAIRARQSCPWYRRSWFAWPLAPRVASVVAAIVVLGAGFAWGPSASEAALRGASSVAGSMASAAAAVQPPAFVAEALDWVAAARVVWRTVLGPVVFYAAMFAVACGGAFALCAAALTRLTLGRATA